ncbi:MAG: N-acetylmuramoyl-L-alanine amidase [Gammaproteobacteria bacterium]|nr:N-acetylmuramoyl-L-alanine amidase [Gammaproteobacteria bacterium]
MRRTASRWPWLLCAWIAAAAAVPAHAVALRRIRLWPSPGGTRVVLDLSGRAAHDLFLLRDPDRVVMDFPQTRMGPGAQVVPAGAGLVRDVRTAERSGGILRVVLDLRSGATAKSFPDPRNARDGYRLVVDLADRSARAIPATVIHAPPRGRDVVIAVDPGHGGVDPGATGLYGTHEKDVVLAIGRDLAADIDAQPGMRAYLTRDGDYFVPLRDRMRKARAHNADLFVSIHADSDRDHAVAGASVYILSQRGATDEAARWLAERENASDLIGGVSLENKSPVLASVLLDLSQSASMTESEQAAQDVLHSLEHTEQVHYDRVQQARFVVLKSPDIPSMLVETDYISNPREELRLRTPAKQMKIARAILAGVRRYFYANPPPGTRIAQWVAARAHKTLVADGAGRAGTVPDESRRIDAERR